MQDPSYYNQIRSHEINPQFPEPEVLKCPRCDSSNTKFCYYNNYNLSQPRHLCKNCKRYWTKGGTLRKIPVGGGSRKNTKRSSGAGNSKRLASSTLAVASDANTNNSNSNSVVTTNESSTLTGENYGGHFGNLSEVRGSFGTLVGSSGGQFGNFDEGIGPNGSNFGLSEQFGGHGSGSGHSLVHHVDLESGNRNIEWPDLAIYTTPGSNFQE